MVNPDQFLRDDQKKARERNSKLNQGANSFHGVGSIKEANFNESQGYEYFKIKAKDNKKAEDPKHQSIVQSEEKLKASKAKSSQQSNTLNQQLNKAQTAKEATKTQSATQTEQEKKSKSM